MIKQKISYRNYFSHDSNSRNNDDMYAMRIAYEKGYQWYFMLLEIMREESNFMLELKDYTYDFLKGQLMLKESEVPTFKKFLEECVTKYNLFKKKNKYIYSDEFLRRMNKMNEVSKARSEASLRRKNIKKTTEKDQLLSNCSAINKLNKKINKKNSFSSKNKKNSTNDFEEYNRSTKKKNKLLIK